MVDVGSYCCSSVGEPLPLVEHHLLLLRLPPLLPRTWYRRDVGRGAPLLENPVRGLAGLVEFPMPPGVIVGRVENRGLEERVSHIASLPMQAVERDRGWTVLT